MYRIFSHFNFRSPSQRTHKTQLNHLEKSSKKEQKWDWLWDWERTRPIPKQMSIGYMYGIRKVNVAVFKCLWNCSDNEHEVICCVYALKINITYCWSITCSHASFLFFIIVFLFPLVPFLNAQLLFGFENETKMRTYTIYIIRHTHDLSDYINFQKCLQIDLMLQTFEFIYKWHFRCGG